MTRLLLWPIVLLVLLSTAMPTLASPAISIIDGNTVVSATGNNAAPPDAAPVQPGETPACANFNYTNPGSIQAVLDYTTAAMSTDDATSNGCWLAYKRHCNYALTTDADAAARQNWTDNIGVIDELVRQGPILLAPDCTDVLKHQDQTNNLLGLLPANSIPAQLDFIAGVGPTTPKSVDWRTFGLIGPVTSQGGETCFAHAAANYMTAYLIMNNIPDVTGKTYLTNATNISPQPLVDCYAATNICATGGFENNMLNFFRDRPQTTIDYFPYLTTNPDPNGISAAVEGCRTPNNAMCTKLTPTSPNSYFMPADIQATAFSMSESQLVYAIATYGPQLVALAVHDNMGNWRYDPPNSISYPGPGQVNTLATTTPALPTDWCESSINHAVMAVGYVLDGDNSYVIIKNSWGVDNGGIDGYWHLTLSNPSTPQFSDPNFGGTCGLTEGVTVVTRTSATPQASSTGVTGGAAGAGAKRSAVPFPTGPRLLASVPAMAPRRAGPPTPAPAPTAGRVSASSISG